MAAKDDLTKGKYSAKGIPWINISNNTTSNLNSLMYSTNGLPWYGYNVAAPQPPTGHIKAINSVLKANIKSYMGVPAANLE